MRQADITVGNASLWGSSYGGEICLTVFYDYLVRSLPARIGHMASSKIGSSSTRDKKHMHPRIHATKKKVIPSNGRGGHQHDGLKNTLGFVPIYVQVVYIRVFNAGFFKPSAAKYTPLTPTGQSFDGVVLRNANLMVVASMGV